MDVNEEFKWLWNLKKIVCGGGAGWSLVRDRCERKIG